MQRYQRQRYSGASSARGSRGAVSQSSAGTSDINSRLPTPVQPGRPGVGALPRGISLDTSLATKNRVTFSAEAARSASKGKQKQSRRPRSLLSDAEQLVPLKPEKQELASPDEAPPDLAHLATNLLPGLHASLKGDLDETARYRGGMPGVWEMITDNATAEVANERKRLASEAHAAEVAEATQSLVQAPPTRNSFTRPTLARGLENYKLEERTAEEHVSLYQTLVILVFHAACNPLSLSDLHVMRRAKAAVETFVKEKAAVIGGLVVPISSAKLQKSTGPKFQTLPFAVRLEAAQKVIETAEMNHWLAVDGCEEGCLARAPGSLMQYLREYTRSRLYNMNYDTAVIQVRMEDTLSGNALRDEPLVLRLPEDAFGMGISQDVGSIAENPLKNTDRIIVEVPKQARSEELLGAAIMALLQDGPQTSNDDTLKRFLGVKAQEFLCQWVAKAKGDQRPRGDFFRR